MKVCSDRIPELDVLRGICLLGMIAAHFLFDLSFFRGYSFSEPLWYRFLQSTGAIAFIMISGICASFGGNVRERGRKLFSTGLMISYITLFGDFILEIHNIRIWFGILHLLGVSMVLYSHIQNISDCRLGLCAVSVIFLGYFFYQIFLPVNFLFPFGLCKNDFYAGSDYFPVFPNWGWFLAGVLVGRIVYGKKCTRFPFVPWENPPLRFFASLGRNSLLIYLVHQAVLLLFLHII